MSKLRAGLKTSALCAMAICAPVQAQPAGPYTHVCSEGGPAILVNVEGLKSRSGTVRIQLYGGDPARYFDKGTYLKRIDVPTSQAGQICLPVPRAGTYAVSVRHDSNGNGKSDRSDGGGMSGNPNVSLFALLLKHKPSASKVQIKVGNGIVPIDIMMNYVQGGSFEPLTQ